mgnify:FL=1
MQSLRELFFGAPPIHGNGGLIQTPQSLGSTGSGNLIVPVRDGMAEIERLAGENTALKAELEQVRKTHFLIHREFMPYIDELPVQPADLYAQACAGDKVTVDSWRDTWIANMKACHEKFGSFRSQSIGEYRAKYAGGTCIVAGSGPSLKGNAEQLRHRPANVPLVSALHNYAFLHDRGVTADFYMTLDAGQVVVDEMCDGGEKDADYYWSTTKDKTLCAFIGSVPDLFAKWQGKVSLFSAPIPDEAVHSAMEAVEPKYYHYISAGGNVLGGSTYFARAILGATTIVWVGNDQAFSYDKQFYGWQHALNGEPGTRSIRWPDVYGITVHTWPSYFNFKCWFDFITARVPGQWINATEGGIIGSYREGNIRTVKQMSLSDVIGMLNTHEGLKTTFEGEQDPPMVLF